MKQTILSFAFCFFLINIFAQDISMMHGKWTSIGTTILFSVDNDSLFISILKDHSNGFESFYDGEPDFNIIKRYPCTTSQFQDKLMIMTEISELRQSFAFTFIVSQDSSQIHLVGDVYYGDDRIPDENENCNMQVPNCSAPLYSSDILDDLKLLKPIEDISKKDVLTIFEQHAELLTTKCNKCYEGFMGADINDLLIKNGYNPITILDAKGEKLYSISGFDAMMYYFSDDEDIEKAFRDYVGKFFNIDFTDKD